MKWYAASRRQSVFTQIQHRTEEVYCYNSIQNDLAQTVFHVELQSSLGFFGRVHRFHTDVQGIDTDAVAALVIGRERK